MRRMKRIAAFTMALVLTALACGCNNKEGSAEMPVYDTKETFRLGNWGVPPHANTGYMEYANNPDYCNIEEWTKMRECGFNFAIPTVGSSVEEICRDLEMADETGMEIWVRDQTNNGFETIINYAQSMGYDYEETYAEIEKRAEDIKANIDTYKKYKSFKGVNVYDEPSMDYMEALAACQDWFLKYYPEYEFYFVLLPVYARPIQLYGAADGQGLTYPDYVSEFATKVNPFTLSYDHYPILRDYDGGTYVKEDFLYNLNVFAKEAQKRNVPVYVYLQTMGFYENVPISTYEEFAWQCYTSMAFGVKGIMCFQYWTQLQEEKYNNVRGGIVERDGTITPLYYEVQKVFQEIQKMEDVYLHYSWDGVKTYESGRNVNEMFAQVYDQLEELKSISKVENDQDIIIGQFLDDDDKEAYMVTNASEPFEPTEAKVSLTFDKEYNQVMVVKKGERSMVKLDNHVLDLEIGSGEGYFVVPVK